ncbi:MAG: hypothetical protein ACQGVC_24345 [Myxococcota bacterium]
MANSPVFDHTCDELERRSDLDRLAARGTVRIALQHAGLDASSVDAEQMTAVLGRVLPRELTNRGVASPEGLCQQIAESLARTSFDVTKDRAGAAADAIARFGS